MMWFVVITLLVLLFIELEDILEFFKSKHPVEKKKMLTKEKLGLNERQLLLEALKDHQGQVCTLKSKDFIYTHSNSFLKAKIIRVDEEWIALEFQIKKTKAYQEMIFKTSCIESFSSQV